MFFGIFRHRFPGPVAANYVSTIQSMQVENCGGASWDEYRAYVVVPSNLAGWLNTASGNKGTLGKNLFPRPSH